MLPTDSYRTCMPIAEVCRYEIWSLEIILIEQRFPDLKIVTDSITVGRIILVFGKLGRLCPIKKTKTTEYQKDGFPPDTAIVLTTSTPRFLF